MTDIPQFPEIFDSTIRAAFTNCPRKGYWEYIRNIRKSKQNIHFFFGGLFAKAMEVTRKAYYQQHMSEHYAILEGIVNITNIWEEKDGDDLVPKKGSGSIKTYPALIDAIDSYFKRWSLSDAEVVPLELPNGELFIERTFAFPLEGTSHPITGKPIVYAGRLDMLGHWRDTDYNILVDEKTSSSLGDAWAKSWPMRAQFTGYMHGVHVYGYKVRHCHIRGVGILTKDITFAEDIQTRHDWEVDRWLRQVTRDVNRAADTYKRMYIEQESNGFDGQELEEFWDQNGDTMCSSYGGCDYMDLCKSQDPERWLNNYETVIWNPLADKLDDI